MTSATHSSAALIPAIEAAALVAPTSASRRAEAFAILGLAAFEAANGSPTEPITEAQLDTKLKDCVDVGDAGPADLAERMRNAARYFAGAD